MLVLTRKTQQKIQIARALDEFEVEYIELTSPVASPQSFEDCKAIANLGLKTKILTHTRCHMADARQAVATGVAGPLYAASRRTTALLFLLLHKFQTMDPRFGRRTT